MCVCHFLQNCSTSTSSHSYSFCLNEKFQGFTCSNLEFLVLQGWLHDLHKLCQNPNNFKPRFVCNESMTRWWFHKKKIFPSLGKWSNLTSVFFKWVGSTTNWMNFDDFEVPLNVCCSYWGHSIRPDGCGLDPRDACTITVAAECQRKNDTCLGLPGKMYQQPGGSERKLRKRFETSTSNSDAGGRQDGNSSRGPFKRDWGGSILMRRFLTPPTLSVEPIEVYWSDCCRFISADACSSGEPVAQHDVAFLVYTCMWIRNMYLARITYNLM